MNTLVVAVILAFAVATAHAGYLGAPLTTGIVSTRIVAAPQLVAAPVLRTGLLAAPALVSTRTVIAGPALGAPLVASPFAAPLLRTAVW